LKGGYSVPNNLNEEKKVSFGLDQHGAIGKNVLFLLHPMSFSCAI